MKATALLTAACGLSLLMSAGPGPAADVKAPATPAERLAKSLQTWQELKVRCGGNYTYTVGFESFAGFGNTTEIVVRDNKIAERRYREFNRRVQPVPAELGKAPAVPPGENWTEKGEQLGSHKKGAPLKTLDDLYAEARKVAEAKLPPEQQLHLTFDKQGLLQLCFTRDTRIADDAPRTGVAIRTLQLELPKK